MAKIIRALDTAIKELAQALGKPTGELSAEYSKKYGMNWQDQMLKDAEQLKKTEIPKERALTTIVTGPAVPVGRAKDVPLTDELTKVVAGVTEGDIPTKQRVLPPGPIGASSSPAASSASLTSAVNSGALPKDPIIKAMADQQPLPSAVGEIKASGKHKGKMIAGGLVAAGAGAYGMGKGEEAPPESTPAEIAKQVSDKELSSKINSVTKAKSPSDYRAVVASFKAPADELLSEDEKAGFNKRLEDLDNKIVAAQEKYEKDKDRTAWSEVAEKVGFALAQIGAGLHGLNTGVDVSGMKFSPTNWEARYDRSLAELKNAESGLQKGIEQVRDERKDKERSLEKKNEDRKQLLFNDYLNTKKINADFQQTKMRIDADLEAAKASNDAKAIKLLEKEKEDKDKELKDRLAKLMEVKADIVSAADSELTDAAQDTAKKNFKDNLLKLGKGDLAKAISDTADSASWRGYDYADPAVLKLIDAEIESTQKLFSPRNSGQGEASGIVYILAPGATAPAKIPAASLQKYLNKGWKQVQGP